MTALFYHGPARNATFFEGRAEPIWDEARLRRFLLVTLSAAAAAGLFYLALRYLLPWCLPFLPALPAAALIEPAVGFLQRRLRFRRGFSALLLTLVLLFLLGGLLSLLWTTLTAQLSALLEAAPAFLDALPAAAEGLLARAERLSPSCPDWLRAYLRGQLTQAVSDVDGLLRALAGRALALLGAAAAALPGGVLGAATCVLAVYFTSASYPALRAAARRRLPRGTLRRLGLLRSGVTRSLAQWLRAQLTLSAVTFCELLLGFLLLRQRYALLLALLITALDALPVFGTGTALVPWAAGALLFGSPPRAIALLALYLCALLTRSVLEPKLLSARSGLPPLASLAAMYLGFCSFGVAGMVLFPVLLLLLAQLLRGADEAPEGA